MLVVTEPYFRSMEAAGRTFALARELEIPHLYAVANKVRNPDDQAAIEQFCLKHDMTLIGTIPEEPQFTEAERNGVAPIDYAPHCPGSQAIRTIAGKLRRLATKSSAGSQGDAATSSPERV